jgi:hypothetical protein
MKYKVYIKLYKQHSTVIVLAGDCVRVVHINVKGR